MKIKKLTLTVLCSALLIGGSAVQAADKIKVGLLTTLSGSNAVLGVDVRDGFNLGIKHSGDRLGNLPVDLSILDDQLNPESGRQAAERFIKRDRVDVMTGVVAASVLLPILPGILASDTIYLSTNTGPADYAGAKCNKNFFAVAWQNEDIPRAMGVYATSKKIERVAIIAPNYPGGRESLTGFKNGYGGKIVEEIYTKLNQLDFASELTTLRSLKPDAVFFFLPGGMGVNFIKQFHASGLSKEVALLAPGFSADMDTIRAVGDSMVGLHNASQWAADLDNEANKRFVADFTKTYGRAPTMYASQGYDAARLIDSAVRAVGGKIEDRAALRAALNKADFKSVRGSFRFNRNQFPIQDIYTRVVVKDEAGQIGNKLVGTIVKNNEDTFVKECSMK
ncbi:ABC transporter substrate-binding protein [Pigmentiphaga kullae]|uniref:Amino acid/amide ABC transporter substrate-binding protein (HAAT family) n=1 Tax=Pigmentiphaga kullae TaxID=151784 RepID=A0A4Q7NN05_9BURK|nr:ABC transporter substrate-binding protein [Pigmentiphaga kullae]RZS86595.1 amino acid/amide ABC transporter substrate-binding protein (HAAT family) [Pigmentiphaga kullae]